MSLRLLALVLALVLAPPLGATSVSNGKVTRIRDSTSATKVFIEITPRPPVLACTSFLTPSETYVIDADTTDGRALYAQLLAAYNTQTYVGILGSGTCEVFGVSPFQSRFERVTRVVACNPAPSPTCVP